MEADIVKQLRIRSGALKRIHKEYTSYQAENASMQQKSVQMEQENDQYKKKTFV